MEFGLVLRRIKGKCGSRFFLGIGSQEGSRGSFPQTPVPTCCLQSGGCLEPKSSSGRSRFVLARSMKQLTMAGDKEGRDLDFVI